jgi:hypothetical protein
MPHRPHDSADRHDAARWETGRCPPLTGFLMVVSAQLEPVDDDAALERLDELARPLFGLAERDGREQARELAAVLTREPTFTLDELAPSGLHVDAVLERRSGHPMMLAVVLAEVGLRAGLSTVVLSSPRGWYTGLPDGERLQLIDTAAEPLPAPDAVRRHCAHEVAFAALLGLTDRYCRLGDDVRANRAAALRRRLCVARADRAPTHGAFDPLEVLWASTP